MTTRPCAACGMLTAAPGDRYCEDCGTATDRTAWAEKDTTRRTATCDECGFSGSLREIECHSCYVQQQGGRCEDYPCCGHVDGDGCQTRPEHTSAYWYEAMTTMDPYEYNRMTEALDR
jgi:hypothetical protein